MGGRNWPLLRPETPERSASNTWFVDGAYQSLGNGMSGTRFELMGSTLSCRGLGGVLLMFLNSKEFEYTSGVLVADVARWEPLPRILCITKNILKCT